MGENYGIKMNNSEEINFQPYIDSVKQRKIPWNIFEKFMKDFTNYLDSNRLKKLNAILLTELTMNYSDLDRLKYLNIILLAALKNSIESEDLIENSESENKNLMDSINSSSDSDFNEEIIKDNESEIQIMEIKNQEISRYDESNLEITESKDRNLEDSMNQSSESELDEEIIKENESGTQIQIMESKNQEEKNSEYDSDKKAFLCQICKKEYGISFHLKQHIRKVHEKIPKGSLKSHIQTFHKGHKGYKCTSSKYEEIYSRNSQRSIMCILRKIIYHLLFEETHPHHS